MINNEIAVICRLDAIDTKNGYSRAMELYDYLSDNYYINIIVPCELNMFVDTPTNLSSTISMQIISSDNITNNEEQGIWKYYDNLPENEELVEKLRIAAEGSSVIICEGIYFLPIAKKAFPDRKIILRALDIEYDRLSWSLSLTNDASNKENTKELRETIFNFEKKAYEMCSGILTATNDDTKRICDLFGVDSKKISVLPICLSDISKLKILAPRKREKTAIIRCLIVSTLLENPDCFLNLAKKNKNVEFHIIGQSSAQFDNAPNNIITYGVVSDERMCEISNICDFAVNISHMTFGMNVKMLDYFSWGIPIIANKLGVRGYNVKEYQEYIPADFDTFEKAFEYFLNMNENQRYELAVNGFNHICIEYDYSKYLDVFLEISGLSTEESETNYEFYIFGAGKIGKIVLEQLTSKGYTCVGFVDNNLTRKGDIYYGKKIFAPCDAFLDLKSNMQRKRIVIAVNSKFFPSVIRQVLSEIDYEQVLIHGDKYGGILNNKLIDINKLKSL